MSLRKLFLTTFALTLIICVRAAIAVPLIPLEKFFDNPLVDNCQISPDGHWISCLKPYKGKLNVFVRDSLSNSESAVTSETERPVLNYFWSADSKSILYLQDHLGDENYNLFAASIKNKTPVNLTPFPKTTVEIISIPFNSEEILISMNKRNPELTDPYWLNTNNGKLRLAAENPGNFTGYLADLTNQVRVATAINANGETEIHVGGRAQEKVESQIEKQLKLMMVDINKL